MAADSNTPALAPTALPEFPVRLVPPDLDPWRAGNTGVPGFTTRDSGKPGPHVALMSLMHGNEIAGAVALDRLLRAGVLPLRGRLTFGFANLAAFDRFDERQPTQSRFIDEDLNRVWDDETLDGPRKSHELARAREMRAAIDQADLLLDLHSMLWPSDPLSLCGRSDKGRALACAIGTPALVVADDGHAAGRRLIDYAPFLRADTHNAAVLVEAGQHWEERTVENALDAVAGLLRHAGLIEAHEALPAPPTCRQRVASVSQTITVQSGKFAFQHAYRGGDVVRHRDTLIAYDGTTEIRTPHDDCLLVMPSLRPSRGQTAVRLARFVDL